MVSAHDFDPGLRRDPVGSDGRRSALPPPLIIGALAVMCAVIAVIAWSPWGSSDDPTGDSAPVDVFDADINFAEGFNVGRIAARIADRRPPITAEAFLAAAEATPIPAAFARPPGVTSVEGLLFPATYSVAAQPDLAGLASEMLAAMEHVAEQENLVGGAAALGRTPYEILTIASMIEKEAKVAVDRPLIARVIYNRLELGMPLQIDATVYYGQDDELPFPELRQTDTPHNTYLNEGLPATPIASPGQASINAALHPADDVADDDPMCADLATDEPCRYLFYVLASEDGSHDFSVTYDQHLAKIEIAKGAGVL